MSNINYSNGKIYKILNYIDDQCYVGSTTQALSKRMVWHRDAMLNYRVNHRPLYKLMNDYDIEMFYIELIEDFPCETVEQLRKRVGELIRELGTSNKQVSGRTQVEHRTSRTKE